MYLRTPKRYTAKGSRRPLLNLRWLWLYIVVPIALIPLIIVWNFRGELAAPIGQAIDKGIRQLNPQTPTATIPPAEFQPRFKLAVQSGRINTALQILNDWTDSDPNNQAIHSLLAQWMILRAYGTDNSAELLAVAAQAGQRAINADPYNVSGWISYALVLDWSGKPQEALIYALQARDLDEKDPMVLAVLAEIYHDLEKDDQATELVEEAIKLAKASDPLNRPALTHAYYVQAIILQTTSPYGTEADDAYKLALQAAGGDTPEMLIPTGYISFNLALDYWNTEKSQLAIDLLTKAMQRDQDDPLLPYLLGRVYFKDGDDVKAQKYFDACRDLDPNQPKCLRQLSQIYMRKSNWTQAAKTYQQLVDQGSTVANDYLGAAQAYANQNQCSTAIPILQKGIGLADSDTLRASFEDALRACGSAPALAPAPVATDSLTGDAGPQPTAKPISAPPPK